MEENITVRISSFGKKYAAQFFFLGENKIMKKIEGRLIHDKRDPPTKNLTFYSPKNNIFPKI